jgi:hypothetical protein
MHVGLAVTQKTGFELIEFEEIVKEEKGAWLTFMRIPTPENSVELEKDAKGKPIAKKGGGKGPSPDEIRPTFGSVWVSFEALNKPGVTTMTQRVQIGSMAAVERREEEGEIIWEDELETPDLFEPQKTYIYFTMNLSHPIVPAKGPEEPKPDEIVPVK